MLYYPVTDAMKGGTIFEAIVDRQPTQVWHPKALTHQQVKEYQRVQHNHDALKNGYLTPEMAATERMKRQFAAARQSREAPGY